MPTKMVLFVKVNNVDDLLFVVFRVRQHGGRVEHDLVALVDGVHGIGARHVACFQSSKTREPLCSRRFDNAIHSIPLL